MRVIHDIHGGIHPPERKELSRPGVLDQVAAGWAVGRIRQQAPSANASDLKAPVAPAPTPADESETGGNGLAGGGGA